MTDVIRGDPYSIPCPKCGARARAEFVDIGVGEQQCTPYACENEACQWVEGYDGDPNFELLPPDDERPFE